jgi:hypothetical protein
MVLGKTCLVGITAILIGCGDDGGSGGSNPVDPQTNADVLSVVSAMGAATEGIDAQQLFSSSERQVIEGESGQVVITLTKWSFEDYSPDGAIVINGELAIGVFSAPFTIDGELQISGTQEALVTVDMTLDLTDAENPQLGGKIIYNGVRFEIADLLVNAEEAETE